MIGIFEFTENEYNTLYKDYQLGILTKKEWEWYCYEWLDLLARMNKKVLDNLKNV